MFKQTTFISLFCLVYNSVIYCSREISYTNNQPTPSKTDIEKFSSTKNGWKMDQNYIQQESKNKELIKKVFCHNKINREKIFY